MATVTPVAVTATGPVETDGGSVTGGKEVFTDQTNLLPRKQVPVIFAALSLCVTLAMLDQFMLSTAIPVITSELGNGGASSWIVTAYVLTSAAGQPVIGSFSTIFGRKSMLIASVIFFLFGSVLCASAQTMVQLIVYRAIQGIGAGGIQSLQFIIMADVVSLKERGRYMPILEANSALVTALGPLLGAALATAPKPGWRWAFIINAPLSVLVLVVIWFALPLKRVEGSVLRKLKAIDYLGAVLTVAGAVMIMTALSIGGIEDPWGSGLVIGLFIGGGGAWIAFGVWEWKWADLPMIPMHLFRNASVASLLFATTCIGAMMGIAVFFIPLLFQLVFGYGAVKSALAVLPMNLSTTVVVMIAGQAQSRSGRTKILIVPGLALSAIGLGLLSTTSHTSTKARTIGLSVLVGCAQGLYMQTTIVAVQGSVPRADMAAVSSVRSFVRMMGTVLGLSIATTIINASLRSFLVSRGIGGTVFDQVVENPIAIHSTLQGVLSEQDIVAVLEGFMSGFDRVFQVLAAWCGASALILQFGMREVELTRPGEEEEKAKAKLWLEERKARRRGRPNDSEDQIELNRTK